MSKKESNSKIAVQLRNIADSFRENISIDDYDVVLFFLILHRDGILSNVNKFEDLETEFLKAIELSGTQNQEAFTTLVDFYIPKLKKIHHERIISCVNQIKNIENEYLISNFHSIFDDFLFWYASAKGRHSGEFILPKEISRFAINLIDLPQNSTIYNPFGGFGSFGVYLHQSHRYIGQELHYETWIVGLMRIMAYQRNRSLFLRGDSLEDWNPYEFSNGTTAKYDLIISNPPFGVRLQKDYVGGKFGPVKSFENFFIEKGLEDLNDEGKLVAIFPQGFLWSGGTEENMRKHLIENDLLEMVISLPSGILKNSQIPITLIVINKEKTHKDVVRFIDASDYVEGSGLHKTLDDKKLLGRIKSNLVGIAVAPEIGRRVSNNEIQDNNYNLNVGRYLISNEDFLNKFKNLRPLGDVLKKVNSLKPTVGEEGKIVRIKNLKDDSLDFNLNQNNLEIQELKAGYKKISNSCLLVTLLTDRLRPTYFEYKGEPIYLSQEVTALEVNQNLVNLSYLVTQLHAQYFFEQIEKYRMKTVISKISIQDFLGIKINIPQIYDQDIFESSLSIAKSEKSDKAEMLQKIEELQNENKGQLSYLRHTLAGPVSNLKASLENLQIIIEEKILPINPAFTSLKVSDNHILTFNEYLENIKRDISQVYQIVGHQLSIQTDFKNRELIDIDIIHFLSKYQSKVQDRVGPRFAIVFDYDKTLFQDESGELLKVSVRGNPELFTVLLDNLVENAQKHGFVDGKTKRIEIYLMRFLEEGIDNEVTLLVSNTGKPIPEGFTISDFIRKGSKSGDNAGDGFGGWFIKEIIELMNGSIEIIDETGPEGLGETELTTSFEIVLPISNIEHNEI